MSEKIILIGADETGLNGTLEYTMDHPDSSVVVLYPEWNPLSEFSCEIIERYMGRGIDFPEEIRAIAINQTEKRVLVRNTVTAEESALDYDKLIFASGAAPGDLDIPGEYNDAIVRVGSFLEASRLPTHKGKTLVVGNGINLLLTISALLRHNKGSLEIVLTEADPIVSPFSENINAMVKHHLSASGVTLHTDQKLLRIEKKGKNISLVTKTQTIEADRLINASQSIPITQLASGTTLELSVTGGIITDPFMRTSDPNIFACGNCASFIGTLCREPIPKTYVKPTDRLQSSILNKILRGNEASPITPLATYSIPLGGLTVAGAGMTIDSARHCGFSPISATAIQFDRAHFMPDASLMTLELVVDAPTRRVLGIQGLSQSGDALCGRISAVAALLPKQPTIEDIANLEIAYSPPFASAMDILNTVANVADNILAGTNEGISATEFEKIWHDRESNTDFFLDCREKGNAAPFIEQHPLHWNHIPQGELASHLEDVPRDKRIILICNTGTRSYEAQVLLKHDGRTDVVNVDGGMTAIRQSGIKI